MPDKAKLDQYKKEMTKVTDENHEKLKACKDRERQNCDRNRIEFNQEAEAMLKEEKRDNERAR